MKIGLSFDLKPECIPSELPSDVYEEFDSEITIKALKEAIEDLGYEVILMESGKKFIENVLREKIEFVFNIAEGFGTRSREGHVPSVCEMLNIPYSGSDPLALNITLDKEICKRFAKSIGVKTPPFKVIKNKKELKNFKFKDFPCVLKLKNEGSSIGLRLSSRVLSLEELKDRAEKLLEEYKEPVLIEKFIGGEEITAGIIGNKKIKFFGLMEIRSKKLKNSEFLYSLEVKRNFKEEVEYIVPPEIPEKLQREIKGKIVKIKNFLDLRDFSRFDFRLDENYNPYFLEINPLPGLNPETSDFPIMAYKMGLNYKDIIKGILESAFERYGIK